jgi:hypothetical protein
LRNRPIQAIDTSPHTLTAGWIAPLQAQAINEKSVLVKGKICAKKAKKLVLVFWSLSNK